MINPYNCSFWKDEMFGYNWEVSITHLERIQFVRMMIEKRVSRVDDKSESEEDA